MYKVELVYPSGLRKSKGTFKLETTANNVWQYYLKFFDRPGYTKDPQGNTCHNSEVEVELTEID